MVGVALDWSDGDREAFRATLRSYKVEGVTGSPHGDREWRPTDPDLLVRCLRDGWDEILKAGDPST